MATMFGRVLTGALLLVAAPAAAQTYTGYFRVLVTDGGYERFDNNDGTFKQFSLVGQTMVLRWSSATKSNVPSPVNPSQQLASLTTTSANISNSNYTVSSAANNDPFNDGGRANQSAAYSGNSEAGQFIVGYNSNDGYDSFINFTFANGGQSATGSGRAIDRDDAFETFRSDFGFDIIGGGAFAAVPEPASWAMMIGGFALAGAAMRRRVQRPASA